MMAQTIESNNKAVVMYHSTAGVVKIMTDAEPHECVVIVDKTKVKSMVDLTIEVQKFKASPYYTPELMAEFLDTLEELSQNHFGKSIYGKCILI